ncbi:MAG: hypothetical protein RQ885_12895 [Desulfurococcales archaeon]|nr:hypothetical protein [Desulfurococcales archaeon]
MLTGYRAPHHVTGFWIPIKDRDPYLTGSLGVGVLLEPGMIASENPLGGCIVEVNEICLDRGPVEIIMRERRAANSLHIKSSIPPGVGGAVSAFASLSLSCEALRLEGRWCGSNEDLLEASRIAHKAEVLALTGLGDVIAMITGGGLVIRLRAGAPGIGYAVKIEDPALRSAEFTLAQIDRQVTTPDILRNLWDRIYIYGREAYRQFERDPGLENFMEISHRFSQEVGFLDRDLESSLETNLSHYKKKGYLLGYYIKKSILVIAHERGLGNEIASAINKTVKRVFGLYRAAYRGFEAVKDVMDTS